jgi:hypothetical protein
VAATPAANDPGVLLFLRRAIVPCGVPDWAQPRQGQGEVEDEVDLEDDSEEEAEDNRVQQFVDEGLDQVGGLAAQVPCAAPAPHGRRCCRPRAQRPCRPMRAAACGGLMCCPARPALP